MKENKFLQLAILFSISSLLPLYLVQVGIFSLSFTLYDLFLYIALIVVVICFRTEVLDLLRSRRKIILPISVILGLFILGSVLGLAVSSDLLASLAIIRSYVVSLVIFLLISFSLCRDEIDLRYLQGGYFFSTFLLSLHALYQYVYAIIFSQAFERISSVFESPNYLALTITPAILLVIMSTSLPRVLRGLRIIFVIVAATALILTVSRGALVALLVAGAVWALRHLIGRLGTKQLVVMCLGVLALVLSLYGVGRVFIPERIVQSDSVRVAILDQSIKMIVDSPWVGYGLGQYQQAFSMRTQGMINFPEYITPHARTAHNVWLNMWLQTGIFGLVSIVLLYALLLSAAMQGGARERSMYLCIFIFYFVYGVFESVNWKNDLMIVFWLLMSWPVYQALITLPQAQKKN